MHEVGHALGLLRPNSGHINQMSGFRIVSSQHTNVMESTSLLDSKYFSVGQVMAIHLSTGSWLNMSSALDGSTLRSRLMGIVPIMDACSCPETASTDNCPALNLDISRDGTLSNAPLHLQACSVKVTAPAAPITCGAAATPVIAYYEQGGLPARADPAWISLTPSIVSVEKDNFYTNNESTRGLLTGKAAGVGTIKVWASGASTTFSVTVNGSC
jgi:hypothetical protein